MEFRRPHWLNLEIGKALLGRVWNIWLGKRIVPRMWNMKLMYEDHPDDTPCNSGLGGDQLLWPQSGV